MPQHPAPPDETDEGMSAEAVIARAIARRGEIFDEFRLLAQESPRTYDLISKIAGYMHHYTGAEGTKDERLGPGPRELIAIAALCARGEVEFAAQNMGQTLLVENTTGAAGLIGAQRAARATPDGYTIVGISDSTVTYVPILQKRADFEPFQPLNVLDPVSLVSSSTWVLIAHPSMPAKSVSELVALVKSQSQKFKKIDYAYAGDVLRARRGAEAAARATPARAGRGQCTTHTVVAANPHHC